MFPLTIKRKHHMPTKEISMKKIKTVLRLHYESELSQQQIADSLQLSVSVVNKYVKKAKAAGLSWPLPTECEDEKVLYERLHAKPVVSIHRSSKLLASLTFADIHKELKQKGV